MGPRAGRLERKNTRLALEARLRNAKGTGDAQVVRNDDGTRVYIDPMASTVQRYIRGR